MAGLGPNTGDACCLQRTDGDGAPSAPAQAPLPVSCGGGGGDFRSALGCRCRAAGVAGFAFFFESGDVVFFFFEWSPLILLSP
jgi:hypothetical protein